MKEGVMTTMKSDISKIKKDMEKMKGEIVNVTTSLS
jgi:hypothetical protein